MKNILRSIVITLALFGTAASTVPMTACASQESRREGLVNVADGYVTVVRSLNAAKREGDIDQDTWDNEVNPAIQEGRDIYNDLVDAELSDDQSNAAFLRAALSGVLSRLTVYTVEAD
jgi:hypothetical protein